MLLGRRCERTPRNGSMPCVLFNALRCADPYGIVGRAVRNDLRGWLTIDQQAQPGCRHRPKPWCTIYGLLCKEQYHANRAATAAIARCRGWRLTAQ